MVFFVPYFQTVHNQSAAVVTSISAEERFQNAASRHQQHAQKHLEQEQSKQVSVNNDNDHGDYVSSEEEDLNDEGIMDGLLKSFQSNGQSSELGSTQEYLMNSIKSKANVCLICIETIKKNDAVSLKVIKRLG